MTSRRKQAAKCPVLSSKYKPISKSSGGQKRGLFVFHPAIIRFFRRRVASLLCLKKGQSLTGQYRFAQLVLRRWEASLTLL